MSRLLRGPAPAYEVRRRLLVRTTLALCLAIPSGPVLAAPPPDAPPAAAPTVAIEPAPQSPDAPSPDAPSPDAARIAVHLGEHPDYGRVVFDVAPGTAFHVARQGERVVVSFGGHSAVAGATSHVHNIRTVIGGTGQATIAIAAGSRVHAMRTGAHVVVDILDAMPPAKAAPPAPVPATITAATRPADVVAAVDPGPVTPPLPPPLPIPVVSVPLPAPAAAAAPAVPPPPGAGPLSLLATRLPPAPGQTGAGLVLPFGLEAGAAAFRVDGQLEVVFDASRPIDLSTVAADPVFGQARLQVLADSTVLSMPLADAAAIRLERRPEGWAIVVDGAAQVPGSIGITPAVQTLVLHAGSPGRVVVVQDPAGGGVLLVGTQREPGQAVGLARKAPEFTLMPTLQGVVVQPASDRIELRSQADCFVVSASGEPHLSLPPASSERRRSLDAAMFTTRFKLPAMPREGLLRRLDDQIAAAASAPALARFPARFAAAQTMLALGMGAEAQALLLLARREDPQHATDPDAAGLAGIAALLAGRSGETEGLSSAELTGSDDVALWRAVRDATLTEGSPDAASVFAADATLLLSYPGALRDRLLPLAAETMAQAGPAEAEAARRLVDALPGEPGLAFARGLLAQRGGDVDGALLVFDTLAQGRDRLLHARAARAATELRLASGRIDASQAAEAMERQIVAWRGDSREEQVRLRAAELRAQAGEWKPAMALLRETAALFPADRDAIGARVAANFARLLAADGGSRPSSLDLVSLVEDNADLLPAGDATARTAPQLADRLVALDLPARAGPALERLMASTEAGAPRARIGARLADMRLEQGNAAAALSALDVSAAPALPEALVAERGMLQARADARLGDLNRAVAVLAALHTPEAADLRAQMLAQAHDWPGALAALSQLSDLVVPARGPLSAAQEDVVLRQAGAAAQAGDNAVLRRLQTDFVGRLAAGPRRDLFRLLAAEPVQAAGDLPRAASEIAMARTAASGLQTISAR
jgi:hypothetical protein